MKKLFFLPVLLVVFCAGAQEKEKVQAAKGVVYGTVSTQHKPVALDDLKDKLTDNAFSGQVKGKVVEVCKAEGCWIRLEKGDGSSMLVRARDHAFLMPENIVGKTVVIEGDASVKEISEDMRRHYAEDAGKSIEEIAKIRGLEMDIQFSAKGVKVIE